MKRKAGALMLLAALGGCMSADKQPTSGSSPQSYGGVSRARTAQGYQGPYGEPITAVAAKPADAKNGIVQASATAKPGDSGIQQANFSARRSAGSQVAPPVPGAVAAIGALPGVPTGGAAGIGGGGAGMPGAPMPRSSIRFTGPTGMKIAWYACTPDNKGFSPAMVEVPGRYNFIQGGVYRLKLTDIPNRPALELYPTLEVMPVTARTATFLAHSAVPIGFTEEDFEQVTAGNLVIKVIYLPDPQYQDLAVAGPDEVVSSRLEPGVDPILEAQRRGSVLAVIRIGNIDLEAPNTPPLYAPPATGGLPIGPGGPGGPPVGIPGSPPAGPNGIGNMPFAVPPGSVPPGMMPPSGGIPSTVPGTLPPGVNPPGGPTTPVTPLTPPGTPPPPPANNLPTVPAPTTPPPVAAPGLSANPNAGRSAVISPAGPPAFKVPALPPAPGAGQSR